MCRFETEILIAGVMSLALAGCEARGTDEAQRFAPPPLPLAADTHVDFSLLKERVLTPYCLDCHAEFQDEAGVSSFVKPGDPGGSTLYLTMAQGMMPPGETVPDTVLEIVRDYVAELQ
jgi:hypothetical protein